MIVLTTGPGSLARLMKRDGPSQHLAPGQVHDHQDQGDQAESAAKPKGGVPAARLQTSSTATATASPPPMHRLATPFLPPRA